MTGLLIILPFVVLIASIVGATIAIKRGVRPQKALACQMLSFFAAFAFFTAVPMVSTNAEVTGESAQTEVAEDKTYIGWGFLAAALAVGLPCIGCGIAVGSSAPAAIAACSEDPKNAGRSLLFVALGEGISLFGVLIAILILMVKMP